MADRLCSDYPFMPADQLLTEGQARPRRITQFQGQRPTLKQRREIRPGRPVTHVLKGLPGELCTGCGCCPDGGALGED